jgi:hypothetical protein
MTRTDVTESEGPLYDFSFGMSGWERAYDASIERLAFETAAQCTHSYDPRAYVDAVVLSVFHPQAKTEIVRRFLAGARDLINEEFDLNLDLVMTRFDGEHGRGGTAYGRIETPLPDDDIARRVAGILTKRCGGVPDFAVDFEGRFLIEWCFECIEVADAGDVDHYPEGDVATAIAERLQNSGVVLESLRSALIPGEMQRRLGDPNRVTTDLKFRPRPVYF